MGNVSRNGFGWLGNTQSTCTDVQLSTLSGKLKRGLMIGYSGDFFADGRPSDDFGDFVVMECGAGFYLSSEGTVEYDVANLTFVQKGTDFGRLACNFPEEIVVEGLTGLYAPGNGTYIMTTRFQHNHPTYLNRVSGWRIEKNNMQSEWWLMDDKGDTDPTRLPPLKNPEQNPTHGEYEDPDCTNDCQEGNPSDPQDQDPPSKPVFVNEPTTPTSSTSLTWTWTEGSDDTSAYRHRLNSSAWIDVPTSTTTFTTNSPIQGDNIFDVQASDDFDNWSDSTTSTIFVDSVEPTPPVLTSPTSPISTTSLTWSWTSSSDTDKCQYKFNGGAWQNTTALLFTTSSLQEGDNTFIIKALDALGNESTEVSSTVVVDTTGPTNPVLTSPTSPISATALTWSWAPGGTASDTEIYQYKFNGGAWQNTTALLFTTSSLQEGDNTFVLKALDALGNESGEVSSMVVVDTTGPTNPVLTSPSSPSTATSLTWSWTGSNDTAKYQYKFPESGAWTDITALTITITQIQQGNNIFKIKALDALGNESGEVSSTVFVDSVGPTPPVLTSPTSPTNVHLLTWSWTGSSDTTKYQYKFNGGDWTDTVSNEVTFNNPSSFHEGGNIFRIKAFDALGNESTEVSSTVVVDTTGPTPPVLTSPSSPSTATSLIWSWTGSNDTAKYQYKFNGAQWINTTGTSVTLGNLQQGDNIFKIKALDALGNESTEVSSTVVIDTVPPTAPIITAPLGSCPNGRWQSLWEACQLSDMGVPATTSLSFGFAATGTIADYHQDIGLGIGEPCVALEADGVNDTQFRADIISGFQEWKEAIESEFPLVTMTFQSKDFELGDEMVPSSYNVTYELPHADNIADIRVGMHKIHGVINQSDTAMAHAMIPNVNDLAGTFGSGGGDLHFDSDSHWKMDSAPISEYNSDPSSDSIKLVAAHEIGHSLGLEHPEESSLLMSPGGPGPKRFVDWAPGGLKTSAGDMNLLRQTYGAASQNYRVVRGGNPITFKWSPTDNTTVEYKYRVDQVDPVNGEVTPGTWSGPTSNGSYTYDPGSLSIYSSGVVFNVIAVDAVGNESPVAQTSVEILRDPASPSNLTVTPECPDSDDDWGHISGSCYDRNGLYRVKLAWGPMQGFPSAHHTGLAAYWREEGNSWSVLANFALTTELLPANTMSTVVKYLKGDTTYEFYVRAFDEGQVPTAGIISSPPYDNTDHPHGWALSGASNYVSYTTPAIPDVTAPPPVTLYSVSPFDPENPHFPMGELYDEATDKWQPALKVEWTASVATDISKYYLIWGESETLGSDDFDGAMNMGLNTDWLILMPNYDTTYYFQIMSLDTNDNASLSDIVAGTTVAENTRPTMPESFPVAYWGYSENKYNEYPGEKWKLKIGVPFATSDTSPPDVDAKDRNDYSDQDWMDMIGKLPYRLECKQWGAGGNTWGTGYSFSKNTKSYRWSYTGTDSHILFAEDDYEADTTYNFRAFAFDTNGKMSNMIYQSFHTDPAPADSTALPTPQNLTVSPDFYTNGGGYEILQWCAEISWNPVITSVGDLKHFRIQRKKGESGSLYSTYVEPDGSVPTSEQICTFDPSTTYYFRIQSVDTSLNQSDWSDWMSYTFPAGDTTPPVAPTAIVAASKSKSKVTVVWAKSTSEASGDVSRYKLYYTTNPSSNYLTWDLDGVFHADGRDVYGTTVEGLTEGVEYSFVVTARDAAYNESGPSPVATATPENADSPTAGEDLRHWITTDVRSPYFDADLASASSGYTGGTGWMGTATIKDIKWNSWFMHLWGFLKASEMDNMGVGFDPDPHNTNRCFGSNWKDTQGQAGDDHVTWNIMMGLKQGVAGTIHGYDNPKQLKALAPEFTISLWVKTTITAQEVFDESPFQYPQLIIRLNSCTHDGAQSDSFNDVRLSAELGIKVLTFGTTDDEGQPGPDVPAWTVYYGHGTGNSEYLSWPGSDPVRYLVPAEGTLLDTTANPKYGNLDDHEWHNFIVRFTNGDSGRFTHSGTGQVFTDVCMLRYGSVDTSDESVGNGGANVIRPLPETLPTANSDDLPSHAQIHIKNPGGRFFIDDIRVYDKWLSDDECRAIGDKGDFPATWEDSSTPVFLDDPEDVSDRVALSEDDREDLVEITRDRMKRQTHRERAHALRHGRISNEFNPELDSAEVKLELKTSTDGDDLLKQATPAISEVDSDKFVDSVKKDLLQSVSQLDPTIEANSTTGGVNHVDIKSHIRLNVISAADNQLDIEWPSK